MLIDQAPLLALVNTCNCLVIALIAWGQAPTNSILGWAACIAVVVLYPLLAWRRSRGKSDGRSVSRRAIRVAAIQAGIAGFVWASAGSLFASHLDDDRTILLALEMAGLAGGGAAVLSALPMSAFAFALPCAIASLALFFSMGQLVYMVGAVMLGCFICTIVFSSRFVIRTTVNNLRQSLQEAEQRALYEARCRDFAEAASDWMWESDGGGRFTFLSDRRSADDAVPISQLLQQGDTVSAAMEDPAGCPALMKRIAAREPFRDFIYRVGNQSVRPRFIGASGRPRFDDNGIFVGYRGVARDITERVERAQDLTQAQADLKDLVSETEHAYAELTKRHRDLEELNSELAVARDEAVVANEAKLSFLANMSHELRTPLNAIIGFSQLIAEEVLGPMHEPKNRDSYKAYASDVLVSGRHLLDIIDDILDLSRLEIGKLELREQDCRVVDLVSAAVRLLQERARGSGIALDVDIAATAPAVLHADATKVKQILTNLLSNAVKFTPKGGTIRVRADRDLEGGLVFEVTDDGVGMSDEELARATEPFTQGDTIYHKRFGGAGLGLSIVKALAELHQGSMQIASAPNHGTTVRVAFPAERVIDGDADAVLPGASAAAEGAAKSA